MGRGPRKWSEKLITRRGLEGYGKGEGGAYRPWLEAGDFSSLGRTRRVHGLKTGRTHHLFSDIEYHLFLWLEWCADVVDIREQFPLDRALTREVATRLGITHPTYPGTGVPTVMTVDFMVTRRRAGMTILEAFNAKPAHEAEDVRSLEKLEIARVCLAGQGIAHHIVFDTAIPKALVENIAWIRAAVPMPGEPDTLPGNPDDIASRLLASFERASPTWTLAAWCRDFDVRHGLESGCALRAARLLLHRRRLLTDLTAANLASMPMPAFRTQAIAQPA